MRRDQPAVTCRPPYLGEPCSFHLIIRRCHVFRFAFGDLARVDSGYFVQHAAKVGDVGDLHLDLVFNEMTLGKIVDRRKSCTPPDENARLAIELGYPPFQMNYMLLSMFFLIHGAISEFGGREVDIECGSLDADRCADQFWWFLAAADRHFSQPLRAWKGPFLRRCANNFFHQRRYRNLHLVTQPFFEQASRKVCRHPHAVVMRIGLGQRRK